LTADGKPTNRGSEAMASVVPFRNLPALAGYYCAVFALIPAAIAVLANVLPDTAASRIGPPALLAFPAGILMGLLALALGLLGLSKVKQEKHVKGTGHAATAIGLGAIVAVVSLVAWGLAAKNGITKEIGQGGAQRAINQRALSAVAGQS
jgi:hypothetical protein